jgi:hypothetical protein
VLNKLVPFVGLMLLAGPVLAVAAPSSSTNAQATTQTTKKTHKHSHHKKASKPTQTQS